MREHDIVLVVKAITKFHVPRCMCHLIMAELVSRGHACKRIRFNELTVDALNNRTHIHQF